MTGTPVNPENHWSFDVLWAKTLSYFELAFDVPRDSWLHPFWSVLALEMLARTAIARTSPILLADTSDAAFDHLLYGLGDARAATKSPKSIPAHEVLRRAERLLPEFTSEHSKFCAGMVGLRNEELHTGGTPFLELRPQAWQPRFFEACQALLASMGLTLADLLDSDETTIATRMIDALHDDTAKQVRKAVNAHEAVWEERPEDEKRRLARDAKRVAKRSSGHVVDCPACGSPALVSGDEVAVQPPVLEGDEIVVRSTMLPSSFRCTACDLHIDGYSRLHACGLGDTFTATVRSDPMDFYADELLGYDDYNE